MRYPSKFFLTLCSSWLIICLLPIIILWWRYIIENRIEPPQINSTIVISVAVTIVNFILARIAKYPGYRSSLVTLPILVLVAFCVAIFLLILRLPYSVYQLSLSFIVGVVYFSIFQIYIDKRQKNTIAYLSFGRGGDFSALSNHDLYPLNRPDIVPKQALAIVADLSSDEIDERWQRFLAEQAIKGIPVYNYLQVYESLTGRSPIQFLYENNLGSLQPSISYSIFKRLLDISIIVISSPIVIPILILTAFAIRMDSKGKSIFIQLRVGQGGKIFKMYKFRSMHNDAPAQNMLMTQANDNRITKVGKIIRKWRIDELPQFYNVLKGDMSLIGPRPELPIMVEKLDKEIPFYIYRQIVKPGISGWAQVMQGDGHVENIQTKLEYDFYYIKNFSFALDFLIVMKTIQTMLTGFGAR